MLRIKPLFNAMATLIRSAHSHITLHEQGHYVVEQWRDGKLIDTWHAYNDVSNEGKNYLLNATLNGGTQASVWYMGLIDNAGYSALAAGDTYANINQVGNGWAEFASYDDAANGDSATTRPVWGQGAASGQTVSNGVTVHYNITSSGVVKGMFLCKGSDAQTKSDHTSTAGHNNILFATALFASGDKTVSNGDLLKASLGISI